MRLESQFRLSDWHTNHFSHLTCYNKTAAEKSRLRRQWDRLHLQFTNRRILKHGLFGTLSIHQLPTKALSHSSQKITESHRTAYQLVQQCTISNWHHVSNNKPSSTEAHPAITNLTYRAHTSSCQEWTRRFSKPSLLILLKSKSQLMAALASPKHTKSQLPLKPSS